ncbi:MAG: pentapeptide repeat-containing protein [Leptolyngbya sp. SIO3F4]|nr:pentapeptide repeat-containing protein [Leptolyngbya sp. SIO3F4]
MADAEHVELLKQGVEKWNQWRTKNSQVIPNLRAANLRKVNLGNANLRGGSLHAADLQGANLYGARFCKADLRGANLQETDLRKADLGYAKLHGANLSGVNLRAAKMRGFDLRGVTLCGADLRGADLSTANLNESNLSSADLRYAILRKTQALNTKLKQAILTGACLEDWNINSSTSFDDAICEYIYLKVGQKERRPRKGIFQPGEFTALFQHAIDTVDLIFKDGIDWQAFFQSFEALRRQYTDKALSIQAIEKKRGGAFIVRIEVAEGVDKASVERSLKELYETKLTLLEQRYRAELQAKDGEIVAYREQSTNLMEIIKLQAARPPMTEIPKYDLRGAQFAGGFAEIVQGNQIGGTINNEATETPSLAEAAAEIQNLLKQLEASNPTATETDQTAFLNVMIPPTRRERFIGALKSAGGAAIEEIPYGAVLKALVEGWQKPNG